MEGYRAAQRPAMDLTFQAAVETFALAPGERPGDQRGPVIATLTSESERTSSSIALRAATATLAPAVIAYFLYLLLLSGHAWIHPEILSSGYYTWIAGGQESLGIMLSKVFQWQAFDSVNRVRTLNDVTEIVDAIARPYISNWIGAHPSFNISTVITAIAAPAFFFGWCRSVTKNSQLACLLTLVLISTIGFLSLTVVYIHPAKKLNFVSLCAALYFAQRDQENPTDRN
jgi:hypothetical protein